MAVFICPNCSYTQDAPDAYVGRTAKCLKCQARGEITVFKPKPPPPTEPILEPIVVEAPAAKTDLPSSDSVSRSYGLTVIGLLTAMLIAQLFGLTSTKTSITHWEYTVESPSDVTLKKEFQRLGDEGWELVFARRASSEYREVTSYEMIFKRPKQ